MAEGLDDDRRNQTGTASLARLSVGQLVGLQVAPKTKRRWNSPVLFGTL